MSLSEAEIEILTNAGSYPDPVRRQRAVGVVLGKIGADRDLAQEILVAGYLAMTQPSFHLIPRGDAMASESAFVDAYGCLASATDDFSDVEPSTLRRVLTERPDTLAPLRMILGLTHAELAAAITIARPEQKTSAGVIKNFERKAPSAKASVARNALIEAIIEVTLAVMERTLLDVPEPARPNFHSKLDKMDTREGWASVAAMTAGVPYWALLYQRYVGGVWRQVQDAYSERKGDALLEIPIETMLIDNGIPYYRTPSGASGASATKLLFDISPGPDFVIPDDTPSVVIESKIGEDGGTVRDKAARISTLAKAANDRNMAVCAVVDGRGWSERPAALAQVIIATGGRTYTLRTLDHLLELPQIVALRPQTEQ